MTDISRFRDTAGVFDYDRYDITIRMFYKTRKFFTLERGYNVSLKNDRLIALLITLLYEEYIYIFNFIFIKIPGSLSIVLYFFLFLFYFI